MYDSFGDRRLPTEIKASQKNHQFLGSKSELFKIETASPAWAKTNNP
jgi:hypothetical protein